MGAWSARWKQELIGQELPEQKVAEPCAEVRKESEGEAEPEEEEEDFQEARRPCSILQV